MSKGRQSPLDHHIDTFIAQLTAKNYKPQTIGACRALASEASLEKLAPRSAPAQRARAVAS